MRGDKVVYIHPIKKEEYKGIIVGVRREPIVFTLKFMWFIPYEIVVYITKLVIKPNQIVGIHIIELEDVKEWD